MGPVPEADARTSLGTLEFVPAVRVAWNPGGKLVYALEEYADFGPLNHFKPTDEQSHTLFAVIDYGSSSHGLEFGVGRGLTPASDTWVIKLMLMQDL